MQVTSLLSRHEGHEHDHGHKHAHEHDHLGHDEACSVCGHEHEHTPIRLKQTLVGVLFVINAFLVDWVMAHGTLVASGSAMIGAILLGYPIVWTSIKDLRRGIISINELVGIAVLAAFASGDYKTAGVVAFFMLLGEIIETRTAEGARRSIESLIKLTPTKARRITNEGEEEVAASELAVGDVIRIRPGDNVAADGVIVSGQGSFNQATITGESLPVDKKPGDDVFAGTQNLTGVLEIKVSRAGQDTTLGRVRELILAAEKTKLPFAVGFCFRYHEALTEAKKLLSQGAIGEVKTLRLLMSENLSEVRPDYRNLATLVTGGVYDLTHEIDLAFWFAGKEAKVADLQILDGIASDLGFQRPDFSFLSMKFTNRICAQIYLDYFSVPRTRVTEIMGTEGTLRLEFADWSVAELALFRKDMPEWQAQRISTQRDTMFRLEDEEFLRFASGEMVSPPCPLEEAMKSLEVLDRALTRYTETVVS